jgi:Tfp pilus assembly protein PilN
MIQIDFLPERIRQQRRRRRLLFRQGYLMLLCIVALGVMTYMFQLRVAHASDELTILRSRGKAMESQMALREELNGQLADLMIKGRIEQQLGRRVGTLQVLGELQHVLPETMTLTNLTMETVEVPVLEDPASRRNGGSRAVTRGGRSRGKTVKRVRLVITGMAPTDVDVANFIGQLAGSRLFEDVSMGYAKTENFRGRTARKFQANCYLTK